MKKENKTPSKHEGLKATYFILVNILRNKIFKKTQKKESIKTPAPLPTPPSSPHKPKEKSIINKDLYHVNKASFITKLLGNFYVIQNIIMVGYLYYYIITFEYSPLTQLDHFTWGALGVAMFFLVVIFNMFIQIGLVKPNLPKNTFGILSLILPSYIFVGYRYFKYHISIEQTIIDFAFIDTASLVATFLLLIILLMANPEKRNLPASLAQIIFIYPAIATIYFYLNVNYQLSGSSSFAKFSFPYALIILANISIQFKSMKEASIYGSKYSKKPS